MELVSNHPPPGEAELSRELLQRFAHATVDLPMLSDSVQRVLGAASDEKVDAKALSDLIKRDPALAANVLRVCNSPLYAPPCPIVSLQQAVSRLGTRRIREIALVVSAETRVFSVKGFEHEVRALFRHSIATALFAEDIARVRRLNVEESFMAGLLHDVGIPLALQAIADAKSQAATSVRRDRDAVRRVAIGVHESAGRALAKAWKLPGVMADAIASHHGCSQTIVTAQIVALADRLAELALGEDGATEEAVRTHPLLDALNLYPEDVDGLIAKSPRIVELVGGLS